MKKIIGRRERHRASEGNARPSATDSRVGSDARHRRVNRCALGLVRMKGSCHSFFGCHFYFFLKQDLFFFNTRSYTILIRPRVLANEFLTSTKDMFNYFPLIWIFLLSFTFPFSIFTRQWKRCSTLDWKYVTKVREISNRMLSSYFRDEFVSIGSIWRTWNLPNGREKFVGRTRSDIDDTERETNANNTTMALRLYSGHWNNLFRFLITEARTCTPRENASVAEALALLDCRFYHMLRICDTHCHEYTHTSFALLQNMLFFFFLFYSSSSSSS